MRMSKVVGEHVNVNVNVYRSSPSYVICVCILVLFFVSSCVLETVAAFELSGLGRKEYKWCLGSSVVVGDDVNEAVEECVNGWSVLGGNVCECLVKSDLKRLGGGDGGGSTGWTSWVDDESALRLQSCMNLLELKRFDIEEEEGSALELQLQLQYQLRDEAVSFTRWMKGTPAPVRVDLSKYLREAADISEEQLSSIESETKEEFEQRLGLELILLPSGATLPANIRTAPGALVYGTLLYGGAKRYRLLPGRMQRRTGERTAILPADSHSQERRDFRAWLQYGGPERNYQAVDIGPAAILELTILPKGLAMDSTAEITHLPWHPQNMLDFRPNPSNQTAAQQQQHTNNDDPEQDPSNQQLTGKQFNDFIQQSFTDNVGGLEAQIQAIVRRVLDGRVFRAINADDDSNANQSAAETTIREAKALEDLGLTPVRGLLLYGPPGCGKTALARQISLNLKARPPKIVSAPELLDRWVGGSERLIRDLFKDAQDELRICQNDATRSSLHIIVIDEIDAVFRKRTSSEDSGQVSRASAVNQILSMLDGVNAIPNVLLIGMTNRRELLDEALLRPGRLEVQIEIPKPNKLGRRQILQIHFHKLRTYSRLSQPLCHAIDGTTMTQQQQQQQQQTQTNKLQRSIQRVLRFPTKNIVDLSDSIWTGGFTGADIAGLVRCAGSIALARARKQGMGTDALLITLEDVFAALQEIKRNKQ